MTVKKLDQIIILDCIIPFGQQLVSPLCERWFEINQTPAFITFLLFFLDHVYFCFKALGFIFYDTFLLLDELYEYYLLWCFYLFHFLLQEQTEHFQHHLSYFLFRCFHPAYHHTLYCATQYTIHFTRHYCCWLSNILRLVIDSSDFRSYTLVSRSPTLPRNCLINTCCWCSFLLRQEITRLWSNHDKLG